MCWQCWSFSFSNADEHWILIISLTNILTKCKSSHSKDLGLYLIIKITELETTFHFQFWTFCYTWVLSPKIAIPQSIYLIHLVVRVVEGLKITRKLFTFLNRIWNYFLPSLQQLKHLHKLVKLLRERLVCPGNASFSKLSCKESRCLTSWNSGDSGEITSGRNWNKLMETFWFLSFSVFILSMLFPLYADESVQHS